MTRSPYRARFAVRFILAPVLGCLFGAEAFGAAIQENALRDGCKKHYNEQTQKEKYRDCVAGKAPRSNDALIEGCYARYRDVPDKLRQCIGR